MVDSSTTQEFTWRSCLPLSAGNINRVQGNFITGSEAGYHNFGKVLREKTGRSFVAQSARPILLGRATSVALTRTVFTGTSGATTAIPTRTLLFHLPSALSTKYFIVPTEVNLTGWNGLETGPSNYSRVLKFSAGTRTQNPEEYLNPLNKYNDFCSDRDVRFVADSSTVVDVPNISISVPPDCSASWVADEDEQHTIANSTSNGAYMGMRNSGSDEYFVIEGNDASSATTTNGTVDCVSVYGLVYQVVPDSLNMNIRSYRSAFTPNHISDVEGHWTANLIDKSIVNAEVLAVADTIKDRSGNSGTDRDLSNSDATAGVRPSLKTDNTITNGMPTLVFDGSNDIVTAGATSVFNYDGNSEDFSFALVFRHSGNIDTRYIMSRGTIQLYLTIDTSNKVGLRIGAGTVSGQQSGSPAVGVHVFNMVVVVNSNIVDKSLMYINGTLDDVAASGGTVGGSDKLVVGGVDNTRGAYEKFFEGELAELIFFNKVVGETERQKLEGYFAHKYSLTANLPSDHPYKSTVPTFESTEIQEF